ALDLRRQALHLEPQSSTRSNELTESYFILVDWLKRRQEHAALAKLAEAILQDLPNDQSAAYNAACMLADASAAAGDPGRKEAYAAQAVGQLHRVIQMGFNDRSYLDTDADLKPLRSRADYQALLTEQDKRAPASALSLERQVQDVENDYQKASAAYRARLKNAWTVAEKKRARAAKPKLEDFAGRLIDLADKHPDSPAALTALTWVLETVSNADDESDAGLDDLRYRTVALLERDHFARKEMAGICRTLAETPTPAGDRLLQAMGEKHTDRDVRGLAIYALALSLVNQADLAEAKTPGAGQSFIDQAQKKLDKLTDAYSDVTLGRTTLGEAAKAKLREIRFLRVDCMAQDIDGEDLKGQKMKLSDFRGKVVVLDFWANWCGYCRQEYPHQKALVKRMQNRPFVLVGVNADDDKDLAKSVMQREGMTWRSWWDRAPAGDRISDDWQVDAFPTVFILDAKGVIRYHFTGLNGQPLDEAVEKLVKEREAELAGAKP
ncbi:MAG TPA: TlpA disulfide reductase family protein, partial [Gemmataceae bacterium]|nr:TlpA disulfide reductase family protein [Gemmataceae bacterium]